MVPLKYICAIFLYYYSLLAHPYRPTENPIIYNNGEFAQNTEKMKRPILPDIINSNRSPFSGIPSNYTRARSKSPYQAIRSYEFDNPRTDNYEQLNRGGRISPFTRPNDANYNQQRKKNIFDCNCVYGILSYSD